MIENPCLPAYFLQFVYESFTNYVDKLLAFFDHLPTPDDKSERIPLLP